MPSSSLRAASGGASMLRTVLGLTAVISIPFLPTPTPAGEVVPAPDPASAAAVAAGQNGTEDPGVSSDWWGEVRRKRLRQRANERRPGLRLLGSPAGLASSPGCQPRATARGQFRPLCGHGRRRQLRRYGDLLAGASQYDDGEANDGTASSIWERRRGSRRPPHGPSRATRPLRTWAGPWR